MAAFASLSYARLPPSPPLLSLERPRSDTTAAAGEIKLLRDTALELANRAELRAALSLFETSIMLRPHDPVIHSDLGVTWMRLGDWAQAWGAFGRALDLDPQHALALQNRDELRTFLGNQSEVVTQNLRTPPRAAAAKIEHAITPLPSYGTVCAAASSPAPLASEAALLPRPRAPHLWLRMLPSAAWLRAMTLLLIAADCF